MDLSCSKKSKGRPGKAWLPYGNAGRNAANLLETFAKKREDQRSGCDLVTNAQGRKWKWDHIQDQQLKKNKDEEVGREGERQRPVEGQSSNRWGRLY